MSLIVVARKKSGEAGKRGETYGVLSTSSFRLGVVHSWQKWGWMPTGKGVKVVRSMEQKILLTLMSTKCLSQGLTRLVCPMRYDYCYIVIASKISFEQPWAHFCYLVQAVVPHFDNVLALPLNLRAV